METWRPSGAAQEWEDEVKTANGRGVGPAYLRSMIPYDPSPPSTPSKGATHIDEIDRSMHFQAIESFPRRADDSWSSLYASPPESIRPLHHLHPSVHPSIHLVHSHSAQSAFVPLYARLAPFIPLPFPPNLAR